MPEDSVKIFCHTHNASFVASRSNGVVVCNESAEPHALGGDIFPSGKWLYCCDCQHYLSAANGQAASFKQCPSCGSAEHPRYYSCDQCGTTTVDYWGTGNRKDFRIMPWGQPSPHCPTCAELPKNIPQTHTCARLQAMLTTARPQCPFCETEEEKISDVDPRETLVERSNESEGLSSDIVLADPSPEMAATNGGSSLAAIEIAKKLTQLRSGTGELELITAQEAPVSSAKVGQDAILSHDQFASFQGVSAAEMQDSFVQEPAARTQAEPPGKNEVVLAQAEVSDEPRPRGAETIAKQSRDSYESLIAGIKAETQSRVEEYKARTIRAEINARQAEEQRQRMEAMLSLETTRRSSVEEELIECKAEFNRRQEAAREAFEARIAEITARARNSAEATVGQIAEQSRNEIVAITTRLEAEVKSRQEAEQAVAEAEAKAEAALNAAAEFESRCREMEIRTQAAEEQRRTELDKIKADAEAAVREMEAKAASRVREAEASAIEKEKAWQAELGRLREMAETSEARAKVAFDAREEAEKRCIETEARIRAIEIKIQRAEFEMSESQALARQTEENCNIEIARIKAEAEIKVHEAEAAAKQAEERFNTEAARIEAQAQAMAQEAAAKAQQVEAQAQAMAQEAMAKARQVEEQARAMAQEAAAKAQQIEEQAHQSEERYRARIEETITRVQEGLLALEEANNKTAAAEALRQEALKEIKATREDAADQIQAEMKARQEAERAAADALNRLGEEERAFQAETARLRLESGAKLREAELQARDVTRRIEERYQSRLAEAGDKISSLEARVSEAETRAHRIEEESRIKAARIAAEADARLKVVTAACEQAEEKYAGAQARAIEAESRAKAAAFACKEAERKLAEMEIKLAEERNTPPESGSQPSISLALAPPLQCPMCASALSGDGDRCPGCKTIFSLTDIDAVIGNTEVDRRTLFDAIERYKELAKNHQDFGVHFHLGVAYLNLNQISEALRHLQIVSKLCPENQSLKPQVESLKRRLDAALAASRRKRHGTVNPRTVMIIDDSATVRKLVAIVLERHGHRVLAASGVVDALSSLNDDVPDLVFLDVYMPSMDGYQLCGLLKEAEATKSVPVVMLSGKDGFFDKVRGRSVGAVGYITKPFEPATLIEAVEFYCNQNSEAAGSR